MAQYVREDYEPHFDRSGTARRVLGHITDEDHVGRGPRNTLDRLHQELAEDPHTRIEGDAAGAQRVDELLGELIAAGLVQPRDDGTLEVTEDGRVELVN